MSFFKLWIQLVLIFKICFPNRNLIKTKVLGFLNYFFKSGIPESGDLLFFFSLLQTTKNKGNRTSCP